MSTRHSIIPAAARSEQRTSTPRQTARVSACPSPGQDQGCNGGNPRLHERGTLLGMRDDGLHGVPPSGLPGARAHGVFAVDLLELGVGHPADVIAGAAPHQRAGAKPDHAAGIALDQVEVVEAADDRYPVLPVELLQVTEDGMGENRIETCHRLVRQDHARLLHQGAGDAHALLLPAGKLARLLAGLRADAHAVQRLPSQLAIGGAEAVHQAGAGVHVAQPAGKNVREDRGTLHEVELLEDHPDLPADPGGGLHPAPR